MAKVKYLTFNVAVISRGGSSRQSGNQKGKPQNALAAAAYRSGQKLEDAQSRETYDYNPNDAAPVMDARHAAAYRSGSTLEAENKKAWDFTRKENVVYSDILTPNGAPEWASDRQTLWNNVEAREKRKDSQLARDIIAALPRELSREQQIEMVRGFVRENFTSRGMVADVNIHEKEASDGGKNPHVHIMLTMRDVEVEGFGGKNRSWNNQGLVEKWRASWENYANEYLAAAGSDARVSMKSFKRDGVEKEPSKHLGYEAAGIEKKGIESRRGDDNRHITHNNGVRDAIAARLEWQKGLEAELSESFMPAEERARPPAQLSPLEQHRMGLREYLAAGLLMPAEVAAEAVIRLDDMLVKTYDEARDIGWDVFEKITGWQERENRLELTPNEGIEREREREL